jgi:hypothetical protein
VDGRRGVLGAADVVEVGDRLERRDEVARGVPGEHVRLLGRVRVAELDPDHEPVELRLRQRIGAGVLGRVLGGDDQERAGELVGLLIDRDPSFLHRLEQARLRLRRCPVDLVDEDDVGEDRPWMELEHRLALVEDHRPGHVGGEHVGGALDPRELRLHRARQRSRQGGLADPGVILDQDVAAGDQGHEHVAQSFVADLQRPANVRL